ncbi:MAG TPA: FG-GAP-like repeat-containing protein [Candidatus Acidoferrum sp.]|nr:FG-GAP-like repeat-containing protein [Candidatus Acidoferrum sp.]
MLDFDPDVISRGIVLSRAGKTRQPLHPPIEDPGRRNFLVRCCQGASTALIPPGLRGIVFPLQFALNSSPAPSFAEEFYLHPRYRSQTPLDVVLLKAQAGLDDFVTEKYHDNIAAILAEWSSSLLQSPQETHAVEKVLASDFIGSSLRSVDSRLVRSGSILEIHQNTFATEANLSPSAFLQELRSTLGVFSKILTAEFQVTRIEASAVAAPQSPERLQTRVRYELVGAGVGFHREQRVGHWDLEWISSSSTPGEFRLQSWRVIDETRSRSASQVFVDVTSSAIGSNSSYSAQMLHGVDYWRTVLDGACGINVYGHHGVSVADVDNDGFDDLYVCQPDGLPNRLYRNRGDGTFEDITAASGLGVLENTACAVFADFDNDGRQDVVVVRANGPLLFLNEGGGKFRQKPNAFQFNNVPQGTFTGAAAADYDRDGWLDVYFCLYVYYQGADQYKYPVPYHDAENGPPNFMMRNNRDGTFRDVTAESGLNQNNTRYSFCCGWGDYNRDGWPDLYVANDFGRKNLYRNNGDGTFTDVAPQAGVEDIGAGMGVSWLDYDNDGAEDLYVADMWTAAGERISAQDIFKKNSSEEVRSLYRKHSMGNSLFRNGGNAFQDKTASAEVGMGRWSWSSDSFDFDHDGFPDLYIANGMVSGTSRHDLNSFFWRQVVANSPDQAKLSHDYEQGWSAINELIHSDGTWSGFERNVFYANNRDGTFSDVSGAVGLDFIEDGRAFALGDFDHDGRQEVVLKNRNGPQLRILKNVVDNLPPSIIFCLRGTKGNRDAIGALVTVETETGRQTRALQAGSGFLSQHSKQLFFGLGEATGPVRASIRWPSGLVQNLHDLKPNHRVWVDEGSEALRFDPFKGKSSSPSQLAAAPPQEAEVLPAAAETWLLAPVAAPDFALKDLAGQIETLGALRGSFVLLNFWVTPSVNCQADLKVFDRVHARWAAQGLRLLAVNVDSPADPENLKALVRERRLSFKILRGSDDVAGIYNILYRYMFDRHRDLGLPTSFLIDHQGRVVKVYQGPINPAHVEQDFRHIPQTNEDRLATALPFPGIAETVEFARNYLSYGAVFFQRGYFDQSAASFQLALRDNPASAEAAYGLGSAYLSQQKTAEARRSFERATKLHSSYPDTLANAWNNIGLLDTQDGRMDDAIRCFQEVLRLSPDYPIGLINLGNAYRLTKNFDEARKIFERALEFSPTDPQANYGLGMVYAQADDTTRAYEYLKRALKFRPDYPEALNNLGILYLRTDRVSDAVATFEQCIRVAPAFDQAYLNLARVYSVEETPDKARAVLLELLKKDPDNARAKNMLTQLPQ